MESIDTRLAAQIRDDIIHGVYAEGERLSETQLCETHSVSRTPVRLALRLLEREGIVQRGEGRGYKTISPSIADIMQAVQVRGHLESLAARLMAQSPDRRSHLPAMAQAIESIDNLVYLGRLDAPAARQMQAANETFHTTILNACGNDYVGFACNQISHLPMLAAGSMVLDREISSTPEPWEKGVFRLRLGNAQHQVIHEAIEQGDGVRAEGMMREHSHTMIKDIETFASDLVAVGEARPAPNAALMAYGAEVLAPGHTLPIKGADAIRQVPMNYRDAIRHVIAKTVEGMNAGLDPVTIAHYPGLPAALAGKPHLREFYGKITHAPRACFAGILGWFDENPTSLGQLPPAQDARKNHRFGWRGRGGESRRHSRCCRAGLAMGDGAGGSSAGCRRRNRCGTRNQDQGPAPTRNDDLLSAREPEGG
jgi:GntR family transcriptional regulator of vanillate catabolism